MIIAILFLLISWLGIFAGLALSKIAKEEVKAGKGNLSLLQTILFVLILILFFYAVNFTLLYKIMIAIIMIILIYITKNNYSVLGLIFGLQPSFIISLLIFIFGFPTGSLMHKDNYIEIAKKTCIYLIIGLVALLINNYVLI